VVYYSIQIIRIYIICIKDLISISADQICDLTGKQHSLMIREHI